MPFAVFILLEKDRSHSMIGGSSFAPAYLKELFIVNHLKERSAPNCCSHFQLARLAHPPPPANPFYWEPLKKQSSPNYPVSLPPSMTRNSIASRKPAHFLESTNHGMTAYMIWVNPFQIIQVWLLNIFNLNYSNSKTKYPLRNNKKINQTHFHSQIWQTT